VASVEKQLHSRVRERTQGRIHKDFKLENWWLRPRGLPNHVVLIDLGFMEMLPDEQAGGRLMPAGTPHTMAPEVIETFLGLRPGFDEKCDIYSLGVVLLELLVGRLPYEPVYTAAKPRSEVDHAATLELIRTLDIATALLEAGRSRGMVELVSSMCRCAPEERPTALECLRHDWLVRQGERRRLRTAISMDDPLQDSASQAR